MSTRPLAASVAPLALGYDERSTQANIQQVETPRRCRYVLVTPGNSGAPGATGVASECGAQLRQRWTEFVKQWHPTCSVDHFNSLNQHSKQAVILTASSSSSSRSHLLWGRYGRHNSPTASSVMDFIFCLPMSRLAPSISSSSSQRRYHLQSLSSDVFWVLPLLTVSVQPTSILLSCIYLVLSPWFP